MATVIKNVLKITAVDKASPAIKRLGGHLGNLSVRAKRVSNRFALMTQKSEQFRKKMNKVGRATRNVGRSMTTRVGAPIAAVGAVILKTAATFQKSMNLVEAKSGATGVQLGKLRDMAKDLGSRTQFSASQAAEGMAFLAKAGFKTNEILQATPALLNLAASSQIELGEAANIASNIMGAFNIKASETGRVSDVLAAITASTNVDMQQLAETMKFAGPVAAQFGASLEDTAAAAGLLGNVGIQGTTAGTALKRAFLAFAAPGSKANKLLKASGVTVADSAGNMRRFGDVMNDLSGKLAKMPQQARLQVLESLFGKIGIAGAASLAEAAKRGDLDKLQDQMLNVTGAAERMAKIMNKGAAGSVVKLISAAEGLSIAIGDTGLLAEFTKIVDKITKFTSEMSKADKDTLALGVKIALITAVAGPFLISLGALIPILTSLGTGFVALVGTLGLAPAIGVVMIAFGTLFSTMELGFEIFKGFREDFAMTMGSIARTIVSFLPFGDSLIRFFDQSGSFTEKLKALAGFETDKLPTTTLKEARANDISSPFPNRPVFGASKDIKKTTTNDSKVEVIFKNPPAGTNIKQIGPKGGNLTVNRGFQGAI